MTKTFIIKPGQRPTDDQIREVLEAKKQPITFDEDSPEMSPAKIASRIISNALPDLYFFLSSNPIMMM